MPHYPKIPTDREDYFICTPDLARLLLSRNSNNRAIRDDTVALYAQQMRRGLWLTTPIPIIVADTGRLLDGQHRLLAIIQTGIPIRLKLAQGADEAMFKFIDRGLPRSVSDATNLPREPLQVAALFGKLAYNVMKLPTDDLMVLAQVIEPYHVKLRSVSSKHARTISSASFRAGVILLMMQADISMEKVLDTYRIIATSDLEAAVKPGNELARSYLRAASQDQLDKIMGSATDKRMRNIGLSYDLFNPANARLKSLARLVTDLTTQAEMRHITQRLLVAHGADLAFGSDVAERGDKSDAQHPQHIGH